MKVKFCLTFLVLILLSACAYPQAEYMPPMGYFYTDIKAPLKTDFNENIELSSNSGRADSISVQYYLLGASVGHSGAKEAMWEGLIEKSNNAEFEYKNVLGVYQKLTLITYGEAVNY